MKGWRWSWFLGNCDSVDKMFHKWCWMSKCLKYDFSKYGARETCLVGRVFLSILSSVFSYGRQAGWVCRGNVQTKKLFLKGSLGQVASRYPLKYSKQRERGVCWFCREILKGRGGCGLWNLGGRFRHLVDNTVHNNLYLGEHLKTKASEWTPQEPLLQQLSGFTSAFIIGFLTLICVHLCTVAFLLFGEDLEFMHISISYSH